MLITACKFAVVELSRKRILLLLKNAEGKEALGEIAPYPSLNLETFDEAFRQLKLFVPTLLNTNWTKEKLSSLNLYPSVAFGIESALLQLLDPLPAFSCAFSALFQGPAIPVQVEKALQLGIKSAKLKIGDLSFKKAQQLTDILKKQFHLRIDINQKWSSQDTLRFFSQYAAEDFDYIEDPLKDHKELAQFPLPFALDYRPHFASELQMPMKALVVKPTLIGQISKIRHLNQNIILSSCFDTGIGIFQIAMLAKRLGLSGPHGLGPYLFLEKDVLDQNLLIQEGLIHIPENISLQKKIYASLSDF